ncbi:hypothetical protein V7S43_011214 [Phytophthora oleae]|uniref:Uncharacterized protein n=1 Tax=Phytophthora oleae TaxID=2107226 RepID=A0ABD3FBI8_9STRA
MSLRNKVLDCYVTGRDLSFKSMWQEFKGSGWTRRAPPRRSLDDRYRYTRPHASADGEEGEDFFLGEEAVLDYYTNNLRARAQASQPTPQGATEAQLFPPAGAE